MKHKKEHYAAPDVQVLELQLEGVVAASSQNSTGEGFWFGNGSGAGGFNWDNQE
ncbi:MAG: hypothetical protein II824_08410 [Bacteroidales bacterium]|nr:hypothetical protein [Bacteroidales bacterium]